MRILWLLRKKQVNKKFFFQQNILIFAVLLNIFYNCICTKYLEENHQKKIQKKYW